MKVFKENMQEISLQQLYPWLQQKYEHKYSDKLQQLKKTFLTFYNLTQQIISIYSNIMEQCFKIVQNQGQLLDQQKYKSIFSLKLIIERTIIILHKLVQNQKLSKNKPGAIDMGYCEKFIKNFSQNLNILCTYYHSLNHCQIVQDSFKYEKRKIVQGINKLYSIHNVIKQLYLKNQQDLMSIENHKIYALISISHIIMQRQNLAKATKSIYQSTEDYMSEFYEHFHEHFRGGKSGSIVDQETSNSADNADQTIKKLMRNYFRILHQFSEVQAELEFYLKPVVNYCEQLKNKKKQQLNFAIADSINIFTRITSQLLKTNFSFKNYKKIRIQDLSKALVIILQDIIHNWMTVSSGGNIGIQFKQNTEMLGHRLYKQLGIGLLKRGQYKDNRSSSRNAQKQKQVTEKQQKQKQKDRNKNKQKIKDKSKQKTNEKQIPQKVPSKSKTAQTNNRNKNSKKNIDQHQKEQKLNHKQEQQMHMRRDENQQNIDNEEEEEEQEDQQIKQKMSYLAQLGLQSKGTGRKSRGEKSYDDGSPQSRVAEVVQEISQCAYFILDCMRELEKVESSGLMNMIQQYKQKLGVPSSSPSSNPGPNTTGQQYQGMNKIINKLCEYQRYINSYYRLHENIKSFQKIMKEVILQQFGIKVNINVNININTNNGANSSAQVQSSTSSESGSRLGNSKSNKQEDQVKQQKETSLYSQN